MNNKFTVKNFRRTCEACPNQWDIFTTDGQYIYARYRWGHLSLTLNPWRETEQTLLSLNVRDNLDGVMETSELKEITKSILDWSLT